MKLESGINICLVAATLLVFGSSPSKSSENAFRERTVLKEVPFKYSPPPWVSEEIDLESDTLRLVLDGSTVFTGSAGELVRRGTSLTAMSVGSHRLELSDSKGIPIHTEELRSVHGILSILPPIVAIVFALVFKQVILALLAGIWLGSFTLTGYQPVTSLLHIADRLVIQTLAGGNEGSNHISIIVFTLLLGGMVGITSRMGGMQGIVNGVSRIATNAKRGQLAVWLMGVIIFFDDYTNTLIVGNSTRPLTDRLRVSREKLSYIVDSTAAPITSLAVITSWIGFEISLISQSFTSLGIERNPLATFVASLQYSFYPILAVILVLIIILSGRDYSAMLKAERRARSTGKVSSDDARPLSNIDSESVAAAECAEPRLANGIIPIAVVVGITFLGLIRTGTASLAASGVREAGLLEILKQSDSFTALLWGSLSGCIAAAVLAMTQRLLSVNEIMNSWINGIRSMLAAILILVLAWCIGKVCSELHTADYLVHHVSGMISPRFLPMIVFLMAIGISFSTGTSWGTMSILVPIVIPLVLGTSIAAGLSGTETERILLASIASILSGAVFGDHCSPISDTTIMSSMASAADHVDHVRTQLPYALTAGTVSLVLGYLLTALGVPALVSLAAGCIVLILVVRLAGERTEAPGRPHRGKEDVHDFETGGKRTP